MNSLCGLQSVMTLDLRQVFPMSENLISSVASKRLSLYTPWVGYLYWENVQQVRISQKTCRPILSIDINHLATIVPATVCISAAVVKVVWSSKQSHNLTINNCPIPSPWRVIDALLLCRVWRSLPHKEGRGFLAGKNCMISDCRTWVLRAFLMTLIRTSIYKMCKSLNVWNYTAFWWNRWCRSGCGITFTRIWRH
jgi:hypothetical protein